jgi:hypothetical protein
MAGFRPGESRKSAADKSLQTLASRCRSCEMKP